MLEIINKQYKNLKLFVEMFSTGIKYNNRKLSSLGPLMGTWEKNERRVEAKGNLIYFGFEIFKLNTLDF